MSKVTTAAKFPLTRSVFQSSLPPAVVPAQAPPSYIPTWPFAQLTIPVSPFNPPPTIKTESNSLIWFPIVISVQPQVTTHTPARSVWNIWTWVKLFEEWMDSSTCQMGQRPPRYWEEGTWKIQSTIPQPPGSPDNHLHSHHPTLWLGSYLQPIWRHQ